MTTPSKDEDFVVMPEWFQKMSGIKGLPFGWLSMISGNEDSGKSSAGLKLPVCYRTRGLCNFG